MFYFLFIRGPYGLTGSFNFFYTGTLVMYPNQHFYHVVGFNLFIAGLTCLKVGLGYCLLPLLLLSNIIIEV